MALLALTISPPYRVGNHIELFKRDLKRFSKLKVYYKVYPEFTDNGRLHYHGYIDKSNLSVYLKDIEYLQLKFGYVCMKPIKHKTGWDKYITKEWNITKKYLGLKCPIDSFTISRLTEINENPFDKYISKELKTETDQ